MAQDCEMNVETLAKSIVGPLNVEVIGSPVLCIESAGDANLTPFTATARITNEGMAPVTLTYTLETLRAFRSIAVWPEGQRDQSIAFTDCCGDQGLTGLIQIPLAPGESFLISSWTRHHQTIWSRQSDGGGGLKVSRNFAVKFELAAAYDPGSGQTPISEDFEIIFRAASTN